MIPPGIAALINIICKSCALHFSCQKQKEDSEENIKIKYDFSLVGSILLSAQMFVVIASTFFQRLHRFFIICPCMLTANFVFIPLFIIVTNEKREKMLYEYLSHHFFDKKLSLFNFLKKSAVVPSNNCC
jgi:hypothetical protein